MTDPPQWAAPEIAACASTARVTWPSEGARGRLVPVAAQLRTELPCPAGGAGAASARASSSRERMPSFW